MLLKDVRHIIWDWNGTIFDDALLCEDLTNKQLARLGLKELSSETHQMLFQHPVEEYYRRLGAEMTTDQFLELSKVFHAQYGERRAEAGVRTGVKQFIEYTSARGITHSVLSAYKESDLLLLVAECGMESYFTAVVGLPNCYAYSKVERGAQWLAEQAIPRESAVLIGDTDHDFATAQRMGVECVLIPSGYQHWNILQRCGCPIFETFTQFAEAILTEEEEALSTSSDVGRNGQS